MRSVMLDPSNAADRAAHIVARAKKYGADAADAVYSGNASSQVQMRLGELEDVEGSEGEDVSLRVFVGKRSASSSTSDLSSRALDALAERCVAMAREAPDDPYAGLADAALLMRDALPELALFDDRHVTPAELRALATAAEQAARAVAGVTNSEGGSASQSKAVFALATSNDFARAYAGSSYSISASVLAGSGGAMQRDYAYHSVRAYADLEAADQVGKRAGERAVARLNPVKLTSGPMPVVFDPRAGSSLLGHLSGSISGAAIARKTSFLIDKLGEMVFADGITIVDDPLQIGGLRSRPFDGEGLPTRRTTIIDRGRLPGWLIDSASGRQLGLAPTGHAARGGGGSPGTSVTNLYMEPGSVTADELIADIGLGVYVTELIGMGVNGLTGDYSRGASGFVIRDGKLAEPVAEITIAGNLKDMFAALIPANNLVMRYAVNVPTLRIEGMTIAGD